jgi:hypothetical protein
MSVETSHLAKRDAQTGEALIGRLLDALNHPTVSECLELDPNRVALAWFTMGQSQKSHRVRVRALRQIRHALIKRGPPWCQIANTLPRRVTKGSRKPRPDPLMRQRRIIEEDAIPARIVTPWVREMLRFVLHHPAQGLVGLTHNTLHARMVDGGHRPPQTNVFPWSTGLHGAPDS